MRKTLFTLTTLLCAASAFALTAGTDLFIPAIGHATGAEVNGVRSLWRSDIWVFNPSTADVATVRIFLLLRGQANPTPEELQISLNPGETRHLPDVVLADFAADETFGALRITASTPVVVTGVIYDANVSVVDKPLGSAGQNFAASPADSAVGAGSSTDLIGLDQDGEGTSGTWRSNLALVETTGNPVDLLVKRTNSVGALVGTMTYHLEGFEANQINDVLTATGGAPGTNQRIRLTVTGGTGRVLAAGSRVNNNSGDPSTVEMTGMHRSGRFQGLLVDGSGPTVDGGLEVELGNGQLTSFKGVASIPCGGGSSYTLELAADATSEPVAFNPDGTFSTLVSIDYSDGEEVVFTTDWTLTGARGADGTWSGTLTSATHGGEGDYAGCNLAGIVREWQAGWVGSS